MARDTWHDKPGRTATFARLASIPHGTTINLQGTASASVAGPPVIPPFDPTPFFQATGASIRFPSQSAADDATFRVPQNLGPHIANGSITQAILDDPNTVLRNAIAGQTIVNTVTIDVASAPSIPPGPLTIPSAGGGNANIAFLTVNADVPQQQPIQGGAARTLAGVRSTFWIETVEHVIHIPIFELGHLPLAVPTARHPVLGIPGPTFELAPPFPIPRPITIRLHSTQIQYSQVVPAQLQWSDVASCFCRDACSVQTVIPPRVVWDAVHKELQRSAV